ncbi:NCA2-domain-containing protein [Ramaria rubella]|nr:NCA2-domain-containing protein [Ramaria rubella]
MATFATHQTQRLLQSTLSALLLSSSPSSFHAEPSARISKLHSLLASFTSPIRPSLIQETVDALQDGECSISTVSNLDEEEKALRKAAIGAIAASLYGQVLNVYLQQAADADAEANWWAELEHSRHRLAWYLIETLPFRLKRAFDTIIHTLRTRNLALTPRVFTPSSLRQLFPASSRPTQLAISFFPHLSYHSRVIFHSPFKLTRQECQSRHQALRAIRNDCAERLGRLAAFNALFLLDRHEHDLLICMIQRVIDHADSVEISRPEHALVASLSDININKLPNISRLHEVGMSSLRRPSRLTRLWPRFVIIPPITFVIFRLIYGSQKTIGEHLFLALETLAGFWNGYLVQPFRDVLDTVRTGGEEGARIVSQEGVKADMESLERMVMALSKEKYSFTDSEMEGLSMQVRRGDLTPVLKVYEEDIKSPLRSAVTGSLVRSLLIQVQKMKVDVDIALSGIDKLLKSQELTFAFVGVAPALAVVYALLGSVKSVWQSGKGRGKYGGLGRRKSVWLAIRRVERLLVLSSSHSQLQPLSPLDQGLILLSVAQLRAYAETYLPARSRLREDFLVDVSDLEDTDLGRREKMDVIKRMWRSWGGILGWSSIGGK